MIKQVLQSLNSFIIKLGAGVIHWTQALGSFSNFALSFFYWVVKPPFRWKNFVNQLHFVGNQSLFIVLLSGSFTGMVLAYQTYFGFKIINVDSLIGPVVAITLAKELGPVLTGLILAGRVGAAIAAQIGTMKVTEQIDALEVMGINSIQYLAVPRVLTTTIALPMLAAIFCLIGNLGGYFVGTKILMIDNIQYFALLGDFVFISHIFQGLIKALFFGFFISVIGCFFGFQVTKGAEGVGRATNLAVVWGMVIVLISDYFLTSFLVRILE